LDAIEHWALGIGDEERHEDDLRGGWAGPDLDWNDEMLIVGRELSVGTERLDTEELHFGVELENGM